MCPLGARVPYLGSGALSMALPMDRRGWDLALPQEPVVGRQPVGPGSQGPAGSGAWYEWRWGWPPPHAAASQHLLLSRW